MSWFSAININPQKRGGRKLLASPQAMHAAVMAAFEPGAADSGDGRILWRLDKDDASYRLYAVSPTQPDFGHIIEQAGWIGQSWESTLYHPFLDRLTLGQRWGFKLTANPVERQFVPGKRGRLIPQHGIEHQTNWLLKRCEGNGFEIADVEVNGGDQGVEALNLKVTGRDTRRFWREPAERDAKRPPVTVYQVQYEGVLRVTDPATIREALLKGIGRAKAYGCGMLTLKPEAS